MSKKAYVVVTTINKPWLLLDYAKNFMKFGHEKNVGIICVEDKKTPKDSKSILDEIQGVGIEAIYMSIEFQEKWLKKFPYFLNVIPYNTDNRRNIGFLLALEKGADIIISIDDDNYVRMDEDFYESHSIVGENRTLLEIDSENRWFNICSMMETEPKRTIFPRGYPYFRRVVDNKLESRYTEAFIAVNAGLWLEDPDVDSISRLNEKIRTTKIISENIMLARYTFSPINTQNTALYRDVIYSYYYILMNESIKGLKLDRFGDIWSGLFCKHIVDAMDHRASFGTPVAVHKRNKHNLLKDLEQEIMGITINEDITQLLENNPFVSTSYKDGYLNLIDLLLTNFTDRKKYEIDVINYFIKICNNMRLWVKICDEILAKK